MKTSQPQQQNEGLGMIRLGLIGVANPEFREVYLPALKQLKQRIRVVAVYDSVRKRAETAASLFDAEVLLSFEKLIHRADVDAVLLLTPGWYGVVPLVSAMELRKPALCTQAIWQECLVGEKLDRLSQETDSLLVIESHYRYWPSSLRTRELLATELGTPLSVSCLFPETFERSRLSGNLAFADLLDWGRFLLQRSQLRAQPVCDASKLTVEFIRQRAGQVLDCIPFEFHQPNLQEQEEDAPLLSVTCQLGKVEILGSRKLRWTKQAGQETPCEELLNEQSGVLRQIDHFCRRVAGGLIPVHDLADAIWSQNSTHLIADSLSTP